MELYDSFNLYDDEWSNQANLTELHPAHCHGV